MLETIVQGIIQGLTEFLPVSSSGHLVLAAKLFRFDDLDPAFNVFVQGGTVISLLAYYLPRLKSLKFTRKYVILLAAATIPASVAGIMLEDRIDALFGTAQGLAAGFLMTTIFIGASKYTRPRKDAPTLRDAMVIGVAQAAAILPSLSRSGSTIGTALMLGITPQSAFDFSFLMSIPVMIGSTALSARHLSWNSDMAGAYILGFGVAAVVGYISLGVLAKLVRMGKFYLFAPYTLLLAIISLLLE